MKKEIEQVIHNAAVENIKTSPEMMELYEKYNNKEITLEELKKKYLK